MMEAKGEKKNFLASGFHSASDGDEKIHIGKNSNQLLRENVPLKHSRESSIKRAWKVLLIQRD